MNIPHFRVVQDVTCVHVRRDGLVVTAGFVDPHGNEVTVMWSWETEATTKTMYAALKVWVERKKLGTLVQRYREGDDGEELTQVALYDETELLERWKGDAA